MQFLAILESIGALLFVFFFIGLCIFSHELGHFLAARWRKLHIDAFSIGFKKVWGKKINGVDYRIGCIPLGGYVELPQVDATDEAPKSADGVELPRAKPLDRALTAFAGPFFNIIFGLLLGCVVWYFGMPQDSPEQKSFVVETVAPASPEYQAGLRPGDRIVKFNGQKFNSTWMKFVENIMFSVGKITLEVERGKDKLDIAYTPIDNPDAPGRLGKEKIGYPFFTVRIPIELRPETGGAAAKAGIEKGDTLISINGKSIHSFFDFQQVLDFSDGKKPLQFTVDRRGLPMTFEVIPTPVPNLGPDAKTFLIGVRFAGPPVIAGYSNLDSPAERAGVKLGDRIGAINGIPVSTAEEVTAAIRKSGGKELKLTVKRDGKELDIAVTPREIVPRTIGVELMLLTYPTPFEQFENILVNSYKSLRGMLVYGANKAGLTDSTSTLKPRHMSGPLGMGTILYSSVKNVSLVTGIYFVVMISFALAIFNLLPLPVLDGGHIAFALIEAVIRRPLPTVVIKVLSHAFIALLIGLMVYVTYFDILRLLPDGKKKEAAPAAPAAVQTAPAAAVATPTEVKK